MTTATISDITVEPGDIWRVGEHVLACADVGQDAGVRLIEFLGEPPTLLYSDLPWSASVAGAYRRMAGAPGPLPFEDLVGGVLRAANLARGCAFLEISASPKANATLEAEADKIGLDIRDRWPTRWNHFDGMLLRVKGGNHPHPDLPGSASTHHELPLHCVLSCTQPGDLVMDTCMGFGLIAMAAVATGRRALGTELNPKRVKRSIQKVAAVVHATPERIGTL
jgi:hypothetical protein